MRTKTIIHKSIKRIYGELIVDGIVTIEEVSHIVKNEYVLCNPSLNSKPWGTTKSKSKCRMCFPLATILQQKLF
jgi:hypothetical protein